MGISADLDECRTEFLTPDVELGFVSLLDEMIFFGPGVPAIPPLLPSAKNLAIGREAIGLCSQRSLDPSRWARR